MSKFIAKSWTSSPFSRTIVVFLRDKAGATAIEYALIAAVMAIVTIGGMNQISPAVNGEFAKVTSALNSFVFS